MNAVTYTQIRNNFAATMNQVCDDHAPIIITRQNQSPVVMMSLEDYNAIEETLYLMKSSKNAARILKAMTDVNQDKLIEKEIIL